MDCCVNIIPHTYGFKERINPVENTKSRADWLSKGRTEVRQEAELQVTQMKMLSLYLVATGMDRNVQTFCR